MDEMDTLFLEQLMTEKGRSAGIEYREMLMEAIMDVSLRSVVYNAPVVERDDLHRKCDDVLKGDRFPLEVYQVYCSQCRGRYYVGLVIWSKSMGKIVATATDGSKQAIRINWRSELDCQLVQRDFYSLLIEFMDEIRNSLGAAMATEDDTCVSVIKELAEYHLKFPEEFDPETVVIVGDHVVKMGDIKR